jgi:hypothetical protein
MTLLEFLEARPETPLQRADPQADFRTKRAAKFFWAAAKSLHI